MHLSFAFKDSPGKIDRKIDLLRSQVNRMEHNLDSLFDMSINAQRIVDRKNAEIKQLEMQRMQCIANNANKANKGNSRWFSQ